MTVRATATLVSAAVLLVACGSSQLGSATSTTVSISTALTTITATTSTIPSTSEADELTAAKARWRDAHPVTYHYSFIDDCGECGQRPRRLIVVWDKRVIDPEHQEPSIERAFTKIEDALTAGRPVEVTYHEELGYPTDLFIDPAAREYDGGTHWLFSDLSEGLPGSETSTDTLEDARARWIDADIKAYEFRAHVLCDCEIESSVRVRVEGGQVVDWRSDQVLPSDLFLTPFTIDTLFDEVGGLIDSPGGGDGESAVRSTGSALYDHQLGYPLWVGLDLEIIEPTPEMEALPPRLVLAVTEFERVDTDDRSELQRAIATWVAAGLGDYSYRLSYHDIEAATFSDPLKIVVSDGAITSTILEGKPTEIEGPTPAPIEGYFDLIDRWAKAGSQVDVIYHSELGYPVLVIAIHPDGSSTAFSISDLTPG